MKLIKVDTEWDINILLEDSDKSLSFNFDLELISK